MSEQAAPPPGPPKDNFVPPTAPEPLPTATTQTRGRHFRELLVSPVTLTLTAIIAGIAIVAGASQGQAVPGLAGAAVVVLLAALIVWLMASSRARSDFYTAYAQGRSLTRSNGRTGIPPLTRLLQRGDKRYSEETFSGSLAGGMQGELALYTYEEETRDSDGNRQTTYYHFTVGITNLPATASKLQELSLQRRVGFRFLDSAEDKFRKRQRVELESVDADKRYEIFIAENDSMNFARQVFTPTFIVWLAENAPDGLAFELMGGGLCVNVKGHLKTAEKMDEFCVACSAIARRLNDEAVE